MQLSRLIDIHASYGAQPVLKGASLDIHSGDRIGLIVANGTGKTTLLKILLGIENPDSGKVVRSTDLRIGYVPQYVDGDDSTKAIDWVLSDHVEASEKLREAERQLADADSDSMPRILDEYQRTRDHYDYLDVDSAEDCVSTLIDSLGIGSRLHELLGILSGGEKNVLSLAKALLNEPNQLVLDEPGNHLDFAGLAWLEEFLIKFEGAILIVSHNRHTLDRVAKSIYELGDGQLEGYTGGYSDYRATKLRNLIAQQADYAANQKRLAQLEALVKRLELTATPRADTKAGKRLRARRSQLEREQSQAIEKPESAISAITADFGDNRTQANIVLQINDYSKRFDELSLFENANLEITTGERVAIIAGNGTGKTTLLNDVVDNADWSSSTLRIGPSIRLGYAAQQQEILDSDVTILEQTMAAPPESNESVAFALLRSFLFTKEDLTKKVSQLSGGERNRLQLANLMKLKPNFLVLDEPNNHMDIPAREAIEEALLDYEGTILVESHDRYFFHKVIDRVVEVEDRKLRSFDGSFSEYWQQTKREIVLESGSVKTRGSDRKRKKSSSEPVTQSDPKILNLERRIEEAEENKSLLERQVAEAFERNHLDTGKKFARNLDRASSLLDDLYEKWAELSERA